MQPKKAPIPIEDFLAQRNTGGDSLTASELATMAGVTKAVISRARSAKDRQFMVEPVSKTKVQLWEYIGTPWRKVTTKATPPKKAVKS